MKKLGSACMEYKMNNDSSCCMDTSGSEEDDHQMNMNTMMIIDDVRRGPWTVEEDFALINYIAHNGEGRWNSVARCAGLKRTGKSCRLRWLNYLRPDVRRGNITLEEQLLILELHSRWGNRWSKIAQHLPGRTDNEIKNYWRTRVQKHAKQLKCDVNSKQFKDTMRYLWIPRLAERIQAASTTTNTDINPLDQNNMNNNNIGITTTSQFVMPNSYSSYENNNQINSSCIQDCCYYPIDESDNQDLLQANIPITDGFDGSFISPSDYFNREMDSKRILNEDSQLWNIEDVLFPEQQFNINIDDLDNSKKLN